MTDERIKEIHWSKPMNECEFARAIESEVQKEQAEKIAELEAALRKARGAMETCTPGDLSTGHVIHPGYDEKAIDSSCAAIDNLLKD